MKRKNQPTEAWKTEFSESLKKHVLRGDYKRAVDLARAGLKKYPHEFVCRYQYAKVLGDYADELPLAKKKKLKAEAIRILKPLLRSLRGKPVEDRFRLPLNFYYQSEDFKGMYAFGQRFSRVDRRCGAYAQGLAASLYAQTLFDQGAARPATAWAKRGVQAWKKYDLRSEKYYFAHYSYAKALALAGDRRRALASLQTAARLSKRKTSDWEFNDVLKIIEG